MADISDVQDAIVNLISATIYPEGMGAGAAMPSIPVKVYGGWPDPATLEADLKTSPAQPAPSALHVSVFPLPMERNTTRYPDGAMETRPPINTYAAAILGNTVTITGAPPDPHRTQNVAVGIGVRPYVHTALEGQTPAQIAAALAALIAVDIPAVVAIGADIVIPAPYRVLFARVGGIGTVTREVARSEKAFQITIWADDHANRRTLAAQLDPVLASQVFLPLADGTSARMIRRSSTDMDRAERFGAYRRDLVYSMEYATTKVEAAPEIVAMEVELKDPTEKVIAETLE